MERQPDTARQPDIARQPGIARPSGGRRVLVIDRDPHVHLVVAVILAGAGVTMLHARTGEAGLLRAEANDVDLALVDLELPDVPATAVVCHLRATSGMPIIVTAPRGDGQRAARALDLGADDVLTKPFSQWETLTRVTTLMAAPREGPPASAGRLRWIPSGQHVLLDGQPVGLSRTEVRVLSILIAAGGDAVDVAELQRRAWGYRHPADHRVVERMVARLRERVEDDPADPRILLDAPGGGYRIGPDGRRGLDGGVRRRSA